MRRVVELVLLSIPYFIAFVIGRVLEASGLGQAAYLLSAALVALFAVAYGFMMPWKYSVSGGVVKLCSPFRCVEYEVAGRRGEVKGALWRRWVYNADCVGWRSVVSAWAWCRGGDLYFATHRCRDRWEIYQARGEDYVFSLWLCDGGGGAVYHIFI